MAFFTLYLGDAGFCLADQVKGQEPGGQRQLGGLHDRAGCEGGLVALEPPAVGEAMLMPTAAWATEAIRPGGVLKRVLTLSLAAV